MTPPQRNETELYRISGNLHILEVFFTTQLTKMVGGVMTPPYEQLALQTTIYLPHVLGKWLQFPGISGIIIKIMPCGGLPH